MYPSRLIYYINPTDKHPTASLSALISARIPKNRHLAVLCIGTDRLTGDCLGPVTGTALQSRFSGKISVYGTLEHPVHALNLAETLTHIPMDSFLIAVDACLGVHIGSVTVSEGSLLPGAGVNNNLPAVGHLAITGIVGSSCGNALQNLSTAHLGKVLELSDIIAGALCTSLNKYLK